MTAVASPPREQATGDGGSLTGAGTLVRFMLRRDRVRIPVWVGLLTLSIVAMAASFPGLYLTEADRQARAQLMGAPTAGAFAGPGYGLDDYTFGAMLANEMLGFMAVLVALMSVLLVVRHTRGDEERGRAELVRSGVVGRHATVAAAMTVVAGANLALAVLVAVGLGSLGVESIDWAGSLLFGAALGSVGLVFTGVAAVTAQVTAFARGASGLGGAAIAVVYAVRAAGDIGDGTLSWLSPIGWAHQTRVYVDDRWWPLALSLVAFAGLAALALTLNGRRDLGAGLRQLRPGSAEASRVLASPVGLALRLQRTSLLWWAVGMFAFGAIYGTFLGEAETFIEELDLGEQFLPDVVGAALVDAFLAVLVGMLAAVTGVYVILATLRLRTEETEGRAEPLLATAVSRTRWAASHLTIAVIGGPIVLLASVLGLGLSGAAVLEDAEILPRLLGAALAHLPPLWFVAGLSLALFGLLPRLAVVVWALVLYAIFAVLFGELLGFPGWLLNLSPFEHVPAVPAEDVTATPLIVLSVLAAALAAAGLAGLRRRDLEGN